MIHSMQNRLLDLLDDRTRTRLRNLWEGLRASRLASLVQDLMDDWRASRAGACVPAIGSTRPRVLCFIAAYPNFSETYMHEEIRSLSSDYDIGIVTYRDSVRSRRRAFPYKLIRRESGS
jgi:hypothetical protein